LLSVSSLATLLLSLFLTFQIAHRTTLFLLAMAEKKAVSALKQQPSQGMTQSKLVQKEVNSLNIILCQWLSQLLGSVKARPY
jgi:hypothetical protein